MKNLAFFVALNDVCKCKNWLSASKPWFVWFSKYIIRFEDHKSNKMFNIILSYWKV